LAMSWSATPMMNPTDAAKAPFAVMTRPPEEARSKRGEHRGGGAQQKRRGATEERAAEHEGK
jgi:hypothetical protein